MKDTFAGAAAKRFGSGEKNVFSFKFCFDWAIYFCQPSIMLQSSGIYHIPVSFFWANYVLPCMLHDLHVALHAPRTCLQRHVRTCTCTYMHACMHVCVYMFHSRYIHAYRPLQYDGLAVLMGALCVALLLVCLLHTSASRMPQLVAQAILASSPSEFV